MTCVCRPRSSLSCTRGKIAFHSLSVIFLRMPQKAILFSYCDLLRKDELDVTTTSYAYIRRRESVTSFHDVHDASRTAELPVFSNI